MSKKKIEDGQRDKLISVEPKENEKHLLKDMIMIIIILGLLSVILIKYKDFFLDKSQNILNTLSTNQLIKKKIKRSLTPINMCSQDHVKNLSILLNQCENHQCELSKNMSADTFLELYKNAEAKITLFFSHNSSSLKSQEWESKKGEILSNITTMIGSPQNTFLLINHFYKDKEKLKVKNRSQVVMEKIEKLLVEKKKKIMVQSVVQHQIKIGKSSFFDAMDAKKSGYLRESDLKFFEKDWKLSNKKGLLEDFMFDNVTMMSYPCLKEVCAYLETTGELSCHQPKSIISVCESYCSPEKIKVFKLEKNQIIANHKIEQTIDQGLVKEANHDMAIQEQTLSEVETKELNALFEYQKEKIQIQDMMLEEKKIVMDQSLLIDDSIEEIPHQLSKQQVSNTISQNEQPIQNCLEASDSNIKPSDKILFLIVINQYGQVVETKADYYPLSPRTKDCIDYELKKIRFPRFKAYQMTTFYSFEKKQKSIPQIENEQNHHETIVEDELPDRLSEQDINQVISQNKVAFDDCIELDPDFDRNIKVIFSINQYGQVLATKTNPDLNIAAKNCLDYQFKKLKFPSSNMLKMNSFYIFERETTNDMNETENSNETENTNEISNEEILSKQEIANTLKKQLNLATCSNHNVYGRVNLNIEISYTGFVRNVEILTQEFNTGAIASCLKDALKRVKFTEFDAKYNLINTNISLTLNQTEDHSNKVPTQNLLVPNKLSKGVLLSQILPYITEVKKCASRQFDVPPSKLKGVAVVEFIIRSTGLIVSTSVIEGPFVGTNVGRCIETVTEEIKFPSFEGEDFKYVHHFSFP